VGAGLLTGATHSTLRRALAPALLLCACHPQATGAPATGSADSARLADSAFAALQQRGARAMGVDQSTSSHVFEDLPDGGRIVLRRTVTDAAGVAQIRSHMRHIAGAFAAGDFRLPGFVHDRAVPGTDVMAAKRAAITYSADTLPGGGQVRLGTSDPEAIAAIHAFLAFQRSDHHAAGHDAEVR
jgi:hypothetical protein